MLPKMGPSLVRGLNSSKSFPNSFCLKRGALEHLGSRDLSRGRVKGSLRVCVSVCGRNGGKDLGVKSC